MAESFKTVMLQCGKIARMTHPRPPGPPRGLFGIRNAIRMFKDYPGYHRELQREYGDAAYLHLGQYRNYVFFHPELIREVLVAKAKSFVRWERGMRVFARAHGQSVLITEGEAWQRQRRMLQPGFAPRRFDSYAGHVAGAAEEALDQLQVDEDAPMDFEGAMTTLTMDVIMRTMFSSRAPGQARAAGEAVRVLSEGAMKEMMLPAEIPWWVPLPWRLGVRRALKTLDALIWGVLRERRAAPGQHQDLLAMLMAAADEEGDGGRLSDQEVRDQCMTMFLAGHETTATALTWWGWAMATHPQMAHWAATEVDQVLGGRAPTHADVAQLPYLAQTLKEALRMRPPAPALFTREAVEDVQIGPWAVPKGALVMTTPYAVHHDPRWFPDPDRFDPDRFAPDRSDAIPRGAYLPFGVGPRVCIGNSFAMLEMTQIAAMLLQRFELVWPAGAQQPRPRLHVTMRPEQGLQLVLRPRPRIVPRPVPPADRPVPASCPFAQAHAA